MWECGAWYGDCGGSGDGAWHGVVIAVLHIVIVGGGDCGTRCDGGGGSSDCGAWLWCCDYGSVGMVIMY